MQRQNTENHKNINELLLMLTKAGIIFAIFGTVGFDFPTLLVLLVHYRNDIDWKLVGRFTQNLGGLLLKTMILSNQEIYRRLGVTPDNDMQVYFNTGPDFATTSLLRNLNEIAAKLEAKLNRTLEDERAKFKVNRFLFLCKKCKGLDAPAAFSSLEPLLRNTLTETFEKILKTINYECERITRLNEPATEVVEGKDEFKLRWHELCVSDIYLVKNWQEQKPKRSIKLGEKNTQDEPGLRRNVP